MLFKVVRSSGTLTGLFVLLSITTGESAIPHLWTRSTQSPPSADPIVRLRHGDRPPSLGFLDETLLLSGSRDGTVRIWHAAAGKEQSRPISGPLLHQIAPSLARRMPAGLDPTALG